MSLSTSLGLLGRKVGMMRLFTDDGDAVPGEQAHHAHLATQQPEGVAKTHCFLRSRLQLAGADGAQPNDRMTKRRTRLRARSPKSLPV